MPAVKYETIRVSPLELVLDMDNPRFFRARQYTDQDQIRLYMLEHEDVLGLARSIERQGGLYPGERIIVTEENGVLVVLEGNRRVTACQLLLDPSLVPRGWPMPKATALLRSAISSIEADLVESRQAASATLAARHLEAIRKWEPLAKMRYFVDAFEDGMSPKEIGGLTGFKTSDVEAQIKDYYLLMYALGLPCWTEEERSGELDISRIKITAYLRIFHTKGSAEAIRLSFDPTSLRPVSDLPQTVFDQVIEAVTRATLIDKTANTRTTSILQIPRVAELLASMDGQVPSSTPGPSGAVTHDTSTEDAGNHQHHSGREFSVADDSDTTRQTEPQPPKKPTSDPPPRRRFFETFSYGALDERDPEARGVLTIAREIEAISTDANLRRFPNAAGMLLRTLLDQALRYYLRKRGQWHRFEKKDKRDPTLGEVIDCCRKWEDIFDSSELKRLFGILFRDNVIKDKMDMILHHPSLTTMTPDYLTALANAGMLRFIELLIADVATHQ